MTLIKIFFGLIGLSLVVVVHEAGHFIAARLSGIKVEAFSIGWGKILFSRKWKGTEYRISLFPLGGYCKMQGEQALIQAWETHSRDVKYDKGDMYAASFWKRILVSLSGPVLNLLFATLIFFIISFAGYKIYYYPARVVLASEYTGKTDYPANISGLQSGDVVLKIGDSQITRFDQLQEIFTLNPDKELPIQINRDGKIYSLTITPELNLESGAGVVGIYPWIDPIVREVEKDSFFQKLGILPGDRITSLNGQNINHAVELSLLLDTKPVENLTLIRNGSAIEIPMEQPETVATPGLLFKFYEMRTESLNPLFSLKESWKETGKTLQTSLKGFLLLFKGINLQSAVSGPLRITYITGDLAFSGFQNGAAEGFLTFFRFIALINIALFVMNLLPIPVLDGGQILLFLIEGIFRKKPNPQIIYRYQLLGTLIVFGLILFATMNDILFFSRN